MNIPLLEARPSLRERLRRRLVNPLLGQLRQGATPSLLAFSVALGFCLSILPLPGTTTALCALCALAFRLNPVAIQAANFAAGPLQLLLLLPFIQSGQRLFGQAPLPLAPSDLRAALEAGLFAFAGRFGLALLRGALVWALCAPLAVALLWLLLRPLFARLARLRDEAPADRRAP